MEVGPSVVVAVRPYVVVDVRPSVVVCEGPSVVLDVEHYLMLFASGLE